MGLVSSCCSYGSKKSCTYHGFGVFLLFIWKQKKLYVTWVWCLLVVHMEAKKVVRIMGLVSSCCSYGSKKSCTYHGFCVFLLFLWKQKKLYVSWVLCLLVVPM